MQIDLLPAHPDSQPSREVQTKAPLPQREPAKPAPAAHAAAPLPEPDRVAVSVDTSREIVYRFLDPKTGDLVSQIPPEQVLEIVRGIQDLLREEDRSDRAKVTSVNVRG